MGEEFSAIQRVPAEYIEKRVTKTKEFQSIFKDGTVEFDSSNRIFKYRDLDESNLHTTVGVTIEQQADSMKAAIKAYETNSNEKFSVRWDLGRAGSFSFEETFKDITESTETYLAKGKAEEGFKNRIRGCLRNFANHSESFVHFLDFLPSDSYGSLIYGGFSVILKAASRIGHARENVLDALTEIPEIIANAGILDSLYKGAPRLKNAVSTLYVATLLALEHILLWFHQNAARKFFKSGRYDDNLTTRIENVRKCAEAVRREAELCQQEVNLNTNKVVHAIKAEQRNAIDLLSENIKQHMNALSFNQATALRSDLLNEFHSLFVNSPMIQALVRQSQPQLEDKAITRERLLNHTGTPFAEIADNDIRRCLDTEMALREQDRVKAIFQSDQLKAFFSSEDPAILLVEGNTGEHDFDCSISFFSAMLVESIRQLNIPVIYFFCGLHQNSQPPVFNGPNGMMQALFRQLLLINGDDYISLKRSTMKKLPRSNKSVRKLVRKLLTNQQQKAVTFCIIDGVSFFEIAKWEKRLRTALVSLMKAVNRPKGNGVVKLLLTTSESSRCIPRMIRPEQILSIQEDVIEGDRQGLDSGEVKASMKEAVRTNWRRRRSLSWG